MDIFNTNLTLILLVVVIHILATEFTYNKGSKLTLLTKDNYYDIIHHNFEDYSAFHYTKNIITGSFLLPFLFNLDKVRLDLFKDILKIVPLIIILRSLFTSVTIFPATRENGPNNEKNKNIPNVPFIDYFIGDNYDRMFSGHISFSIILSYLAIKLNLVTLPLIILANLIHAFVIVVTRSHYTIDVLNSSIITYLLLNS